MTEKGSVQDDHQRQGKQRIVEQFSANTGYKSTQQKISSSINVLLLRHGEIKH